MNPNGSFSPMIKELQIQSKDEITPRWQKLNRFILLGVSKGVRKWALW